MAEFEMAPAGGRAAWLVLAVILLVGITTVALVLATMRTARFEVSGEGLRIRGNLYGRLIPLAHLRLDAARVVDLGATPALRPKWRTNGASLPGVKVGWFRLQSGEKALVFVTRNRRAVYLPTTQGYSVLIAPNEPDALLERLRAQQR